MSSSIFVNLFNHLTHLMLQKVCVSVVYLNINCFTFFIKLNHSLSTSLIFDLGNSLNSINCFSLLSSSALYV